MRKLYAYIVLMFTLLTVTFISLGSIIDGMQTGIEFKGGFEITYQVVDQEGAEYGSVEDKQSARDSALEVVANRLDISGVKSVGITASGDDKIIITVASKNEKETLELRELLTSNAEITFRDSQDNLLATAGDVLKDNGARLDYQDGSPVVGLSISNTDRWYEVTNYVSSSTQDQLMVIWVGFDPEVDSYQNPDSQGKIISAATVGQPFYGDVIITGSFDAASAQKMANLIKAGSIDFKLVELSVSSIGASYGETAFQNSLFAGAIALVAITILMTILYGIGGLTSSVSLFIYIIASLLVFNMMNGEYGPDTIAANIISIGMGVDSVIISFERMKDEMKKGKSLSKSFDEGNTKSLSSILDANITTLIAAFALYMFGTRTVKGFAIMLIISIFLTMVIMVVFNKFIVGLLCKSRVFQDKKHWFGIRKKDIPETNLKELPKVVSFWDKFKFSKVFKPYNKGFGIVCAVGAIFAIVWQLVFGNGFQSFEAINLGINFSEGTKTYFKTVDQNFATEEGVYDFFRVTVTNEFANDQDVVVDIPDNVIVGEDSSVRLTNSDQIYYKDILEKYNASYDNGYLKVYTVSITFKTEIDDAVKEYLDQYFTTMMNDLWDYDEEEGLLDIEYNGINFVSPIVGRETVKNALAALGVAVLLIILYVALRFKLSYSISAIAALVHDALIMVIIFIIFRIEMDIEFVSAVLSIIGYSVNDTIVTFDRIRELQNEANEKYIDYDKRLAYTNKALQNTMTRTILTSLSTVLAIIALLVFGSEASINFNIAMTIGLVAGVLSSIYMAPGLYVVLDTKFAAIKEKWEKKKASKPKKQSKEAEEYVFFGIND